MIIYKTNTRTCNKLFLLFSILFTLTTIVNAKAQDDSLKTKKWRIEVEPSGFLYKGFGLQVCRNVTKNNRLNVGFYSASLNVPQQAEEKMFKNIAPDANVRLGFQMALFTRYYFKIFKKESNPYVGTIAGWEYFNITEPSLKTVRISTIIFTPYVGYELYLFKNIIYVNPQLRSVFYFNTKVENATKLEQLQPFFLLPNVSLGFRL